MKSKPIPLETVLDINDDRVWFYIENFNGYEVSNDGYIRSMKHFNEYPFGMLLRPASTSKTRGDKFILTNDNNERVGVYVNDLIELAKNDKYIRAGYPRRTCVSDPSSRNQKAFIKRQQVSKQPEKKFMPSFTILQDTEINDKGCPIYNLTDGGSEYYVRKDSGGFMY